MRPFQSTVVSLSLALVALVAPARADDLVLEWNAAARDAIRATDTVGNPGTSSRNLAMMNLAMYDAVMAVTGTHEWFCVAPAAPEGASAEAAAASAAYGVLSGLCPTRQADFDAVYAKQVAAIPDGPAKSDGLAWGQAVAAGVLGWRATDGAYDPPVLYTPSGAPGRWAPDPTLETEHGITQEAWGPSWGALTPFAIASGDQFRPPHPPSFDSPAFLAAYNQAKEVGALDSATRTADQTEMGVFWAYDRLGTGPPPILFNQVAEQVAVQQGNDWLTNVRMFVMVSTALADAGICAWDAKYAYDLGRPVTVIREADLLGVDELVADPDWRPLGSPGGAGPDFTPPFPTYISGHATFGGALFQMLEHFYGTDDVAFVLVSDEFGPSVEREFACFSDARIENGLSRVYLGIHWDFDDTVGQQVGMDVADYISGNRFQPVPEPATLLLVAAGAAALVLRRRQQRRRDAWWSAPDGVLSRCTSGQGDGPALRDTLFEPEPPFGSEPQGRDRPEGSVPMGGREGVCHRQRRGRGASRPRRRRPRATSLARTALPHGRGINSMAAGTRC